MVISYSDSYCVISGKLSKSVSIINTVITYIVSLQSSFNYVIGVK